MSLKKNPKVDLKRKYLRYCETGLIFSLLTVILLFWYIPHIEISERVLEKAQELVNVEDVVATKNELTPPPPPKPAIPIETPTDDILEDIEFEETDLDVDAEITAPPPAQVKEEDKEEEAEPVFFVAVEQLPEPIGGIADIQRRIVYPEIAKRAGIQGKVFILAYVDENGDVKKAEVIKGIGAGCDEAAVAAILQTKFRPGKQRDRPVKVKVTIPIRFILRDSV